jgi:hypothetical protein
MANKYIHEQVKPCQVCGSDTSKPMYCSNACKVRAYRKARPAAVAAFRQTEADRRQIADAFRVRATVLRGRPKPEPKEPEPKRCRDCPATVGKYQHRCQLCREIAEAEALRRVRASPSYRASKAKRKACERGRAEGAERFDPLEVLERDGWRCHICGTRTPKRLRGTYDDRAPELDHINPLAVGGKHTRQNTACCCRKCNQSKGSKPLGQLRLVA